MVVSAGLRETFPRFDRTERRRALDARNMTVVWLPIPLEIQESIPGGLDNHAIRCCISPDRIWQRYTGAQGLRANRRGLGYDYLLVYDHVLGAHPNREPKLTGPYTYEHPFHEPMVFFGFFAAITTRPEP